MNNDELQKRIIEKVQDKIAIFEMNKEDKKMKQSTKKIMNIAATVVVTIGLSVGTVYAGTIIYEKIWKEPTRIDLSEDKITDEIINKSISEEEAKKIAQDKLIQVGLKAEKITGTDHYRESGTEKLNYRFITDNWYITINGQTGEFYDLSLKNYDKSVEDYTMTKEEAIEVGKQYYKDLGYKEGEYEFAEIVPIWENGGNYSARFYKKYGDLYNKAEAIWIGFYAKEHQLHGYRVENHKCENNPIEITKEEALEIAINEDKKIENRPIAKTNAELRIKEMNAEAYARLNNTEEYYKPMTTPDVPSEEIVAYSTEGRVRTVWVVVLEYEDEEADIVNKVAKGQYSYYIDSTTGEIIGGESSDALRWENYWFEKNKVK